MFGKIVEGQHFWRFFAIVALLTAVLTVSKEVWIPPVKAIISEACYTVGWDDPYEKPSQSSRGSALWR